MLKLKEPEESESELEHRSSRLRSSKVGVGYKRETSLVPDSCTHESLGTRLKRD